MPPPAGRGWHGWAREEGSASTGLVESM